MKRTILIIISLAFFVCSKSISVLAIDNPDWSRWSGDKFNISASSQVEDCILRQSDMTYENELFWTAWNFGASQTLDIGYAIAMWNMWRGNVLVRFDLKGVNCSSAEGATFRIYKPRNVTQVSPEVPIAVYQVKAANKAWKEGKMESLPQPDAASWLCSANGKVWAGGPNGCGIAGVDYEPKPVGTAVAVKYNGEWLEFTIPKALVNLWLEKPDENAGLLIKVVQSKEVMGDHVLFYASEHSSGKGPQLIIYGKGGAAKHPVDKAKEFNQRAIMPPQGTAFKNYIANDNSRYQKWTIDPVVNLQGEQKIYPYLWDIFEDGDYVLPYAYYPLSQSILALDDLIAAKDVDALKKWQINRLKYLHLWEYIREQRWYDCGDIIEHLSPYQAALIWLGSSKDDGMITNGVLTNVHPKGRESLSEQDISNRMNNEWKEINSKVKMTAEQQKVVEPFIREMERKRCENYNICNNAAQSVHQLIANKDNSKAMIDALSLFMNWHDVYLYYDSYWQIKRFVFLLDNTDMVSLCTLWKEQKYNEYSPSRMIDRYQAVKKYWPEDRPAIQIENKNKFW